MSGFIFLWNGAVGDIPNGWALCNGNNGTPNLTDKFVIGAGSSYNPDDTAQTNVATDSGLAYYALAYVMKL